MFQVAMRLYVLFALLKLGVDVYLHVAGEGTGYGATFARCCRRGTEFFRVDARDPAHNADLHRGNLELAVYAVKGAISRNREFLRGIAEFGEVAGEGHREAAGVRRRNQ